MQVARELFSHMPTAKKKKEKKYCAFGDSYITL